MRRHRLDVETVGKGTDCGLVLDGWTDYKQGDVLQCIRMARPAPPRISHRPLPTAYAAALPLPHPLPRTPIAFSSCVTTHCRFSISERASRYVFFLSPRCVSGQEESEDCQRARRGAAGVGGWGRGWGRG